MINIVSTLVLEKTKNLFRNRNKPILYYLLFDLLKMGYLTKNSLTKRNKDYSHFKSQTNLKLNLGCGFDYKNGYINIDSSLKSRADVICDFNDINKIFSESSINEMFFNHSFAYLNLWQSKDYLLIIKKLLAPGGKLIIETPNLVSCAKKIIEASESKNTSEYLRAVRPFYGFDLDEINRKKEYTPYSFGWSEWHLEEVLNELKFNNVEIKPADSHGREWRDFRIEAVKLFLATIKLFLMENYIILFA